jgi:CDP-glucose 4,6-dehydratase
MDSQLFDINGESALTASLMEWQPEIIFHLAAQALVRRSYDTPIATFETNVIGTVKLLEAVRHTPSVRAVVIVTSDKCYENRELSVAYREADPLGGRDPYSASKGCAEIAARSMQQSFFAPYAYGGHPARICTVRAGNVIGGGDWSRDRIVPDVIRGCLSAEGVVELRNPLAVRPWQHVLEPLSGYMMLAQQLVESPEGIDVPWNFGPDDEATRPVLQVAQAIIAKLALGRISTPPQPNALHEAQLLRLDSSRARGLLGWSPRLSFEEAITFTAEWYLEWVRGNDVREVTFAQIAQYAAKPRPVKAPVRVSVGVSLGVTRPEARV